MNQDQTIVSQAQTYSGLKFEHPKFPTQVIAELKVRKVIKLLKEGKAQSPNLYHFDLDTHFKIRCSDDLIFGLDSLVPLQIIFNKSYNL